MVEASELSFFHDLLDSLRKPLLFTDTEHVVRYLNRAAIESYPNGNKLLGRSLLDFHHPKSQQKISEILQQMKAGLEEMLINNNETHRIYMRAVRSKDGQLVGYYERFEPPRGK